MKLDTEIIDREAHKEFRRFLRNTGQTIWERKIAKVHSVPLFPAPSPNAYVNYLGGRNPLTRDIEIFLRIEREGKLMWRHLTPEIMKTCGHLKIINALWYESNASVRQRVESILLDDETVRSFLFELDIATHFFGRQFDVQFADLKGLGTFDLLVLDGQSELEIECKTKTADAGRKITRGNFYLLCDVLMIELSPLTESYAILLKCDGRLSGSQEFFYRVATEIKNSRHRRQNEGEVETLRFEMRELPPGTKIRTHEDAAAVLAPHWSPNAHYSFLSNRQTLIVGCESTQGNRVLKAIYEDLKHGADQLSGTRPSMLACQLEDIYDEDWNRLRGETGLAIMSGKLLRSPQRRHVNLVAYSSNRTLPRKDGAITSFGATNLRFKNLNPEFLFPQTVF